MKLACVVPCRGLVASSQVRVMSYLPGLQRLGWQSRVIDFYHRSQMMLPLAWQRHRAAPSVGSWAKLIAVRLQHRTSCRAHLRRTRRSIVDAAYWADALLVQWVFLDSELLAAISRANCRLIYDFDDGVYLHDEQRFQEMLAHADWVIAGSSACVSHASRSHRRVVHVPSTVAVERYTETAERSAGEVTLGWIGGTWTVPYLAEAAEGIRSLAENQPRVRLMLAGVGYSPDLPDFGALPVRIVHAYDEDQLPHLAAAMDVGLMPLPDNEFTRAKCAMKYLVYSAARRPCVASRVGEIRSMAREGEEVLLATSPQEWHQQLRSLVGSQARRHALAESAHALVADRYSTATGIALWKEHVLGPLEAEIG